MSNKIETKKIQYDDGGWAEIQTLDGEYHGSRTVYHQDGSKSWQSFHKHGKHHGLDRSWYDSGQLEYERCYKDGELHGDWRSWHTNGQLKSKYKFVNGEKRGLSSWYTITGELLAEMKTADDGQRHGTQIAVFTIEDGPEPLRLGIANYKKGEYQGCEYFNELPKGYSVKS